MVGSSAAAPTGWRSDEHALPARHPDREEVGGGPIVGGLALGLVLGLLWELLFIQTDWRLGFSPPVWEIVVGWIGLSAFSAFVILVFGFAGLAIYSTNTMARNPQSWDARQAVADARVRAAAFTIGLGGLMAFGGAVMWAFSRTGPEFDEYGDRPLHRVHGGDCRAGGGSSTSRRARTRPANPLGPPFTRAFAIALNAAL